MKEGEYLAAKGPKVCELGIQQVMDFRGSYIGIMNLYYLSKLWK
jgi:hypothetical protein